jgi:hypothetical protein
MLGVAMIAYGSCVTAYGSLISASDDFSSNSTSGGAGHWVGNWALTNSNIGSSSLNIVGNSDNAAVRGIAPISAAQHHTVNMSFDVVFNGTLNSNTFLGFWLGSPNPANSPNFGIKSGFVGGDFFGRRSGTGGAFAGGSLAPGTQYTIDARMSDTNNDQLWDSIEFRVNNGGWVNATSGSINLNSFNQIGFRSVNMASNAGFTIGRMSITAVPEPTALLMVGSVIAGLCTTRRRKLG